MRYIKSFILGTEGATAVEYAVMLGMILGAVLAAVRSVGENSGDLWQTNDTELKTKAFSE